MVSFRVGNTYLDYDGSPLGMIYRNSILDVNSSLGNRSFQIKFPFTATNDLTFKFSRHVDVVKGLKSLQCECLFQGGTLHSGRLVLFRVSDHYECYFYPNSLSVTGLTKTLDKVSTLNEVVNLGNTSADVAAHAQFDYQGLGYCWPSVFAEEFYQDMAGWTGAVNPKAASAASDLVNTTNPTLANKYAFAPMLYLEHILHRIGDFIGYRVTGDLLEDERFKKFVLFNNKPIDKRGGEAYRFRAKAGPTLLLKYNPVFVHFETKYEGATYVDDTPYLAPDLINGGTIEATATIYTVQQPGTHKVTLSNVALWASTGKYATDLFGSLFLNSIFGTNIDPLQSHNHNVEITLKLYYKRGEDIVLAHVWQTAGKMKAIERDPERFFSPWAPHELDLISNDEIYFQVESVVVDMNTGETAQVFSGVDKLEVEIENLSTAQLNEYDKTFNKIDTLPAVEIKDFFQSLKQWFSVLITPNEINKTLNFTKIDTIIATGETEEWTDKVVGDYTIDYSRSSHHKWQCNDERLKQDYYEVLSDEDDVDTVIVAPQFQALPCEFTSVDAAVRSEYMYVCDAKAISPDYDQGDAGRDLRFIEMPQTGQANADKRTFKSAIKHSWDVTSKVLVNAEPVTFPLRLTAVDLQNLDFTKKKLINGVDYLLVELRVSYETNKIGECFGEFLKLNNIDQRNRTA